MLNGSQTQNSIMHIVWLHLFKVQEQSKKLTCGDGSQDNCCILCWHEDTFRVREMFCILIVMIFTWVYTSVKMWWAIQPRSLYFIRDKYTLVNFKLGEVIHAFEILMDIDKIVFHWGCNNFHSHQQSICVPVSLSS